MAVHDARCAEPCQLFRWQRWQRPRAGCAQQASIISIDRQLDAQLPAEPPHIGSDHGGIVGGRQQAGYVVRQSLRVPAPDDATSDQRNRHAQSAYPIVSQDSTAIVICPVARAGQHRTFRQWARKSKNGMGGVWR